MFSLPFTLYKWEHAESFTLYITLCEQMFIYVIVWQETLIHLIICFCSKPKFVTRKDFPLLFMIIRGYLNLFHLNSYNFFFVLTMYLGKWSCFLEPIGTWQDFSTLSTQHSEHLEKVVWKFPSTPETD